MKEFLKSPVALRVISGDLEDLLRRDQRQIRHVLDLVLISVMDETVDDTVLAALYPCLLRSADHHIGIRDLPDVPDQRHIRFVRDPACVQDAVVLADHRPVLRNEINMLRDRVEQLPDTVILPPAAHTENDPPAGQPADHVVISGIQVVSSVSE